MPKPAQLSLSLDEPEAPCVDPENLARVVDEMRADAQAWIDQAVGDRMRVAALTLRFKPHKVHNRARICAAHVTLPPGDGSIDTATDLLTRAFAERIDALCAHGRIGPAWRKVFRARQSLQIPLDTSLPSRHRRLAAEERLAALRARAGGRA